MRNILIIVLVWAILLGFVATGVKVMASPPSVENAVTVTNDSNMYYADRVEIDRSDVNYRPR